MILEALDDFMIGTLNLVQPWQRFAATFLVVSGAEWAVQPYAMFNNGQPRPFTLLNSSDPNATNIPWWLPGTVVGGLLSVLV